MLCFPLDTLDFSDNGLRVLASGPRRAAQGKPAEKNPDTFRRIFSAQKKVRHIRVSPALQISTVLLI